MIERDWEFEKIKNIKKMHLEKIFIIREMLKNIKNVLTVEAKVL